MKRWYIWSSRWRPIVQPPWVSRYSGACPVCAAKFHASSASKGITKFTCPECEELLEYVDTFRGCGRGLSHPPATGAAMLHELAFDGQTPSLKSPHNHISDNLTDRQTEKDSIPIAVRPGPAISPHPPQSPAATFKSLYRRHANTPCSCLLLAPSCFRYTRTYREFD